MKHLRWRWKLTEKQLVLRATAAHLAVLWVYGLAHWFVGTLVLATLCLLWSIRNWPEEKR